MRYAIWIVLLVGMACQGRVTVRSSDPRIEELKSSVTELRAQWDKVNTRTAGIPTCARSSTAEHQIFNLIVPGSNPGGRTTQRIPRN